MAADAKDDKETPAKVDNTSKEKKNKKTPATHKCGKCKKNLVNKPVEDDEQSIECDCCLLFFHILCADVSVEKLDAVAKHKL